MLWLRVSLGILICCTVATKARMGDNHHTHHYHHHRRHINDGHQSEKDYLHNTIKRLVLRNDQIARRVSKLPGLIKKACRSAVESSDSRESELQSMGPGKILILKKTHSGSSSSSSGSSSSELNSISSGSKSAESCSKSKSSEDSSSSSSKSHDSKPPTKHQSHVGCPHSFGTCPGCTLS